MNFLDHLTSEIQKIEASKASHLTQANALGYTVMIIDLILPVLKQHLESLNAQQAATEAQTAPTEGTAPEAANSGN